jgi:putative CocE/NonD family hydrolase
MPNGLTRFSDWPIPGTRARTWHLRTDGRLRKKPAPDHNGADEYRPDPTLRPRVNFQGGNIWAATPTYYWQPVVDGASLSYLTPELPRPLSVAGTGSVDLWIKSNATDNDVQVTLSEVMANGQERYVQNGWLKLSHRKLDKARSTELNPVHSDELKDMRDITPGRFVSARIALFPFAHQFRAGSQIRLTIQAPGGDRPEWAFGTEATDGTTVNLVAHDDDRPSRLVLPIVGGPDMGETPAPCPSLRAQPCRAYVAPAPNRTVPTS